jgi:VIT1/CCC1 family predicted Fe2+/Mn2+ transporter
MKKLRLTMPSVLEEVVLGVEDSLVSTMGILVGVAAGTESRYNILLMGMVLLVSQALSLAAGSYLSSETESEVWLRQHAHDWNRLMRSSEALTPLRREMHDSAITPSVQRRILRAVEHVRQRWLGQVIHHERAGSPSGVTNPTAVAMIMGMSCMVAGFVPLSAYLFFPVKEAILPSVVLTFLALFLFGSGEARLTARAWWKSGMETVLVASFAAGAAYLVGSVVRQLFHTSL